MPNNTSSTNKLSASETKRDAESIIPSTERRVLRRVSYLRLYVRIPSETFCKQDR